MRHPVSRQGNSGFILFILNSGEADMLSGQASETTPLTLSRPETRAHEFGRIPFARYAPVRRQLLNILRAVNERRKQQSFELLLHSVLKLKRTPVPVYVRSETDNQNIQAVVEAA